MNLSLPGKTILLVEASDAWRAGFKVFLEVHAGLPVLIIDAESTEHALSILTKEKIDIVVMDLKTTIENVSRFISNDLPLVILGNANQLPGEYSERKEMYVYSKQEYDIGLMRALSFLKG